MKKSLGFLFLLLNCILLINGCSGKTGTGESGTVARSEGILPTRLEQIDQGGIVPAGSEARKNEVGNYSLEMLWGTWVLEGSHLTDDFHATDTTIDIGMTWADGTETKLEVECFPKRINFAPAWAGASADGFLISSGRVLAENKRYAKEQSMRVVFGQTSESDEVENRDDPFGIALEKLGMGLGAAAFTAPQDADSDTEIGVLGSGIRKIAYDISGDVLAIGITDIENDEELNQTDIMEVDYKISWTGSKLTLTYGGESAVYVPEQLQDEYYGGMNICNAGPADGSEIMNGICGITVSPEGSSIMQDVHEGYKDASFDFRDDGTLMINLAEGNSYKSYEYDYLYSGDSLTLKSENQVSVYSLYTYSIQSGNGEATYSFYAGDEEMRLAKENELVWFIERGFQTDYDLNQQVGSCQITEAIDLYYNDAKLVVKVINPYDTPITLGECVVCYICVDDTSGILTKGSGTQIGITTYEEIDFIYEAPYEKTDEMIRYKGTTSGIINTLDDFEISMLGMAHKQCLLDVNGDVDVIYDFENGILKDFRIEMPSLLYNGLQDNVDNAILANMQPNQFAGVIAIRDTVLDRLKVAFAEAGISVDINEATGEIVMNNDVLFATDQFELSDEGKRYIDSFMGVYASVITDEEIVDYISKLQFEGHTDSSGSYAYNLTLSQKRADSVLDYCLNSDNGLTAEQKTKLRDLSSTIGYSYSDPITDKNGYEDMDASRRVAIKFLIKID